MSKAALVVVDTGAANTASVRAAFARLGLAATVTARPADVAGAERVVLPGVGAFGPAARRLRANGLDAVLAERVAADRPVLAVCLGLQLLCEASDEAPGMPGLGLLEGRVRAFPPGVLSPQLGWNRVRPSRPGGLVEEGHAYFANGYRLVEPPRAGACSLSDHGGPFVAAVERGALLACQCHPELSGAWGRALLARWIERTEGVPC